jgi:hypothetical protein
MKSSGRFVGVSGLVVVSSVAMAMRSSVGGAAVAIGRF